MKEYFYELDLDWKSATTATVKSRGLCGIEVSSPIDSPKPMLENWTPEHLLAASVSSCFMNTFLLIAKNSNLIISSYQCQCLVKLEPFEGIFRTTEILLRPFVELQHYSKINLAYKCIEIAEITCPIKNALKINVEIHSQFKFCDKKIKLEQE